MKKQIFSTVLLLVLGLMLSVGLSYAATFVEPTSTSDFRPSVITPGTVDQTKTAGLSVNTFSAAQDAEFKQQTFFQDLIRGGIPADVNSTLNIGGVDFGGITHTVNTIINGKLTIDGTLASTTLNTSTEINLCANSLGEIGKCGTQTLYSQNGYYFDGGPITGVCDQAMSIVRDPQYQNDDKTVTVIRGYDNQNGSCIRKETVRMVPGAASVQLEHNYSCGGSGGNYCSAVTIQEIINIQ
jgi:hypothetical protein